MTLPSSGVISISDLRTEFSGPTPSSLSDYYSGGTYVPAGTQNGSGTVIPTSGTIALSNFYGAKNWVKSTAYLGDGVGSYNGGNNGSAFLYGAHTTSGGSAGMPGTCYIQDTSTGSRKYSINLSSTYFPLVPSIVNSDNSLNQYCLGTGDVTPAYSYADVPILVWRNQYSNWTDTMIQNELGLSTAQVAQVQYASQVWWANAYSGMDSLLYYGIAILNSSNYNSGSLGNAWNNKTVVEYFYNDDTGGEWSDHGFIFAPTITSNVASGGTSAFTKTGNTGRDGGGVIGSLSNYCVTLDNYSLVVPIVKSNNGFSGGARNGNRNPFVAKFGYIKLS